MTAQEWTSEQILECTSYGKLWLVADVKTGRVRCRRIRRDSSRGLYVKEQRWFSAKTNMVPGDLFFVDSSNYISSLTPIGQLAERLQTMIKNREV
jgi:hypothetical protein